MYSKTKSYTQGLSLVETLVAITLLLIAVVGPMTIAARSLQTAIFAKEQTAAFYLAQEGIELTIEKRDEEALREITGGAGSDGDFWDWRPTDCGGPAGPANACGLDAQLAVRDCSTPGRCTLRHDTSVNPQFRHAGSAEFTPYTREITIDMSTANIAEVTSVVTWNSPLFGITRDVTAKTFIYNVYDGF